MALLRASLAATVTLGVAGLMWLACAIGGGTTGGGYNLPSAGIVPITLPAEPLLLTLDDADVGRPSGIEQGGEVRVWFGLTRETEDDPPVAVRTIAEALATPPVDSESAWTIALVTEAALEAELDWEGGWVADPDVTEHAGSLHLAYASEGGLGLALLKPGPASANGAVWTRASEPALTGTVSHPSLVFDGDRRLLFFIEGGALFAAESLNDGPFERLDGPLLEASQGDELSGASVRRVTSALDRDVFECVYGDKRTIAHSAAFDDLVFVNFEYNPIVEDPGFQIADPSHAGPLLLHARNNKKDKPQKGRGLGIALYP